MKNIKTVKQTGMFNGKRVEFEIKSDIPILEKLKLVDKVVDTVINEDYYYPTVLDLIQDFVFIEYFTDILSKDEKYSSIDEIETMLDGNTVVDDLYDLDNGATKIINCLKNDIKNAIQYKKASQGNELTKAVTSLMNTLTEKVNMLDMTNLVDFMKNFKNMPMNFTPDEILKSYSKTDMFKENQAERQDISKKKK